MALISDAAIVWRRAFGVRDRDSGAPVDVDTVFEAASTSKPVFAYAVMKLCERGVIDLDTPLTKYTTTRFVPGDPRLDQLTARHVLTHTTGLPNWRSDAEPLRLAFTPGDRWGYSGEGFHYLQSVVSRLTGSRANPNDCGRFELDFEVCAEEPGIEAYMQANLLRSFGMTSSGYVWSTAMESARGDVIRHGGGNPGYSCFVAGFPARKTGYVIMTNGEGSGFFGVIAKLISGDVLGEFLGTRLSARSG